MRTFAHKSRTAQQTASAKPTRPSRVGFGQSCEANSILHLQRSIGNYAVQQLLRSSAEGRDGKLTGMAPPHLGHDLHRIPVSPAAGAIQTELKISEPGDEYEREADRVADEVMSMSDAEVAQRVEAGGIDGMYSERKEEQALQRQLVEEELQAKPKYGETSTVARNLESRINSMRSGGQPLHPAACGFFEPRFGHDFSSVRVHTDSSAAEAAKSLNSKAFTIGQDIAFDSGRYSPDSRTGRSLLAHELTHVVQQTGADGKRIDRSRDGFDLNGVQPIIQRDLAIEPPRPAAVGRVLTPQQMTDAIAFNNRVLGSIANGADIIRMIRDVIGISPLPAVVDEDFVNGVIQWQANFGLGQDGRLGPRTARPLFREIGAEGVGRGEVSQSPRYAPAGPINVPAAANRSTHFDMSAEFRSDPGSGVFPSCCEVRQEIQWDAAFAAAFNAAGGGLVPHAGFDPADPADTWIEDRDTADARYGWRTGRHSDPGPGDQYVDSTGRQNQAFGHRYEGEDNPEITGVPAATSVGSWRFRLGVYDMCNGNRLLEYSPTLVVNWL